MLVQEFGGKVHWSKEHIASLALRIGLTEQQVYKWNWDMLHKLGKDSEVKQSP